jgi:16S rRNA (guanine966-N2)-methyltransferase
VAVRIIAGQAGGRLLRLPRGAHTRPTSDLVRGALFSILDPFLDDASVLDLFAGTGALGIEALSRGAAWADFIENNPRQCVFLKSNLQDLGLGKRSHVRCSRVEQAVPSLFARYDIIFLDPPYGYSGLERLLEGIAPASLAGDGAFLTVEHSRRHVLADDYGPISLVRRRSYGDTVLSIYREGGRRW